MKNDKVRKLEYELETFDFYSTNPLDFSLLTNIDKKLLNQLLNKKEKRKLYACIIEMYWKLPKKGMFESLRAPNEFPDEEFKFIVDFKYVISEHEFTENNVSNPHYIYLGIAEIDIDFYIANYDFFNSFQEQYLIICNESIIRSIDNKLSSILNQFVNNSSGLVEKALVELNLDKFISALEEEHCIMLRTLDTWEFKYMTFLVNDEEDEREINRYLKEVKKYLDELHKDYVASSNKTIG